MLFELRLAFRQLQKSPGFALVAILSLTLGIGATVSVFTIINGVLLRRGPYHQPKRLVFITPEKISGGATDAAVGGAQFDEWEKHTRSFTRLAAYDWKFTFLIDADGNESVEGMIASGALFTVLGIQPFVGRTFTEDEKMDQDHHVVLLGYELWQRRFGADLKMVGGTIRLNGYPPLTVVGIMPPGIRFLPSRQGAQGPNYNVNAYVDFWLPGSPVATGGGNWNVVARLKPGVPLSQARAEMTTLGAEQAGTDPALAGLTARVTPIGEVLDGEIRRVVYPLFGAVGFVLLIASANVTALLLVRGLGRQRELAVRVALGAGWPALLRLALTESVLLATIGGSLGVLLAFAGTKFLLFMAPDSIPRLAEVVIDLRVLGFAVGVSLLTGLSCGALAARQILRPDVNQALKAGKGGGVQDRPGRRLLSCLVAGEVALTFMLLVGAGLMMKTMVRLTRLNPGYETHEIATMVVTSLVPNVLAFHSEALQKISALPGVSSAAFVWGLPLTGNQSRVRVTIEGRPPAVTPQDRIVVPFRSVTADYFSLMAISLRRGRLFSGIDQMNSAKTAVINEEMARRYFSGKDPIGQHLNYGKGPVEIVGIVGDIRNKGLNAGLEPEVYLPFFQAPAFSKHLVIRTHFDALALVPAVKRALLSVDPGVIVEKVKTMDRIRDDSIAAQRFVMTLIGGFSLLALTLAMIGIYGVMSHTVAQRSHELAVRMAIGAQRRDVLLLILKQGGALALYGAVIGLAGSLVLTRVLIGLLFGVDPIDPATFMAVPLALAVVIMAACWVPAQRATQIDPLSVLRAD